MKARLHDRGAPKVGAAAEVGAEARTKDSTKGGPLARPGTVRLETRADASTTNHAPARGVFALRVAEARAKEAELSKLEATLSDPKASAPARGEAGIELALRRLQRDVSPDGAERALNAALGHAPELADSAPARRARAAVRLARGDLAGAQAVLRKLDAADPEVALLSAEATRLGGDPFAASAALAGLRAQIDVARSPGLAARLEVSAALASFAAGHPEAAVRAARKAFDLGVGLAKDTRAASKAAQLLRELVCPDFSAPGRAEVEVGLARASAAFQRGDYDAVQAEAQAILHDDPDEALGYHLFAVAELRRIDRSPLIGPLDSAAKRATLISTFERVLGEAGATPARLFVDWPGLTDLQKAKVAHSALLYGELLPDMLAARPARRIHLVPPGESCATRDPDTDRAASHGFGRYWYGTRGWVGRRDVVIGLEDVERAARGGYDTVTHELAHLAQQALEARGLMGAEPKTRIAVMKQGLGPDQVRSFAEALQARFRHARGGGAAKPVTDYAGTCVEEYFAESMMAWANPRDGNGPTRARLARLDPKMAELAEAIFADVSRLDPTLEARSGR